MSVITDPTPTPLRRVDLVAFVSAKLREARHSLTEYRDLVRRNPGRSAIRHDMKAYEREVRYFEGLSASLGEDPTPEAPRDRCWWHYNKAQPQWGPLNEMLVHFRGEIIVALGGVVCHVPSVSERLNNPEQPRMVMVAQARDVYRDSEGAVHIR